MTAPPSDGLDVDVLALYLSGWSMDPLAPVFHEDVEDEVFTARELFGGSRMNADDGLKYNFDKEAAEHGIDRGRLEVARGIVSRYRFDLLPNDPDHPDAFAYTDRWSGLPMTNRDLAEVYYGEIPDGS
ncbi:hypothetical protein [Streptomyces virginiae]|uniref:hypothetical protein n=1 Tax=Streptomyces virginiae TaxID=1961 RepID=UPI00365858CB